MADARCSCGALTLTLPEPSKSVVACHCLDCQRRTGAPFGVGAFYPVDAVAISENPKDHPRCRDRAGPPLLAQLIKRFLEGRQPTVADRRCSRRASRPEIPSPRQIGLEQSKHSWVRLIGEPLNASSKAVWARNSS